MEIEKQVRNKFEKESDGEAIVNKDSNNNEKTKENLLPAYRQTGQ